MGTNFTKVALTVSLILTTQRLHLQISNFTQHNYKHVDLTEHILSLCFIIFITSLNLFQIYKDGIFSFSTLNKEELQ